MSWVSRRSFLAAAGAGAAAGARPVTTVSVPPGKPALLGGTPVRTKRFPSWPVFDEREEKALIDVVRSGHWFRGSGTTVKRFEEQYAALTGAKYCLATSSGTGALQCSLGALDIGPGDEVILPPQTFVATLNVILVLHALPVLVDVDPETFQIDAKKIEEKITARTKAIIPVHVFGNVSDLDAIMPLANKRKVAVVEDACQSHLAEWRSRKAGTYGATGCFSFQASKNLNCGEGGALLTSDEDLYYKSFAFHWNGSGRGKYSSLIHGSKYLMTEFQAAILLAQLTRLEEQARTREQNAQYLDSMLKEIPGILPLKMYPGCTRNAYHLYKFRYKSEHFAGLTRAKFVKAVAAEGIPVGTGYTPLNKQRYLKNALASRGYRKVYAGQELDRWGERNQCPANDQLCEEALGFTQNTLLAGRSDMEQMAQAILKVQKYAAELAKA